MHYRPTIKSFFGSLVYDCWILFLAAILTFFAYRTCPRIILVFDIIAVVITLVLLTQTIFVHCTKIYLDDERVITSSPLSRTEIYWQDVTEAILYERRNIMSRTDHLLLLRTRNSMISCNTSTLDPSDEERVLGMVRSKTNLAVRRSRPSV